MSVMIKENNVIMPYGLHIELVRLREVERAAKELQSYISCHPVTQLLANADDNFDAILCSLENVITYDERESELALR